MAQIIALVGYYGVGKSTAARTLREKVNGKIFPIADALRIELVNSGILTLKEAYDKPTTPRIREILNKYGQAKKEEMGEYYWISKWLNLILEQSPFDTIIVDDLRFKCEYDYIINKVDENPLLIWVGTESSCDEAFDLDFLKTKCQYILNWKP